MSGRRRWTRWRARRRRSGSWRSPERSSGRLAKVGSEEGEEGAERLFLATVRGGGDEDDVAARVGGELFQEVVTKMAAAAGVRGVGAGVGLVDDHQLRSGAQEAVRGGSST